MKQHIIGAGGYGIVIKDNRNEAEVYKLFKDIQGTQELLEEAKIQDYAYELFELHLPYIKIPKITGVETIPIVYGAIPYLRGIGMEYLEPPKGFDEQVHILLGYEGDDIDSEWGAMTAYPVSETNPTRGFFASPETMEMIWDQDMTIEKVAYWMGISLRLMIDHGIVPIDLEWVWANNTLCILDFGLCETRKVDPDQFLKAKGLRGLVDDIYVPHEGQRGYEEFIKGYNRSTWV